MVLRLQLVNLYHISKINLLSKKFLGFDRNDSNISAGTPLKDELICVSKGIPVLSCNGLPWKWPIDLKVQEWVFRIYLTSIQFMNSSKRLLCNCVYELDSSACDLIPNLLPIGPLPASSDPGHYAANFWPEDSTCIGWLDKRTCWLSHLCCFWQHRKLNPAPIQ